MALGVAFYVAVAASVSAAYVESEAQKTKARTIRGIRSREAEDITKKNIESGEQTQATADRFKGPERTALTESQDRRNIESLKAVQEDVREGTDPSDTGFAGTSQTFAGKREERQAEDAEKAEADRLASARFLSPGQSGLAEQQFIQDLGIENQGLALEARGIQQVANAEVAGVPLKNQGLVTMLKIISYAASAYSIATAGAASAGTEAGKKAYEETAKKAIEEAAKEGAVRESTKVALREQFAAAGFESAYAHPLFEGATFGKIAANAAPGGTNAITNTASQLANTPVATNVTSQGPSLYQQGLQNLPSTAENRFFENLVEYTPADISQTGGSTGAFGENFSTYGVKPPSVDFAGGLAPSAKSLDDEFFRVLLKQQEEQAFFDIHGFAPPRPGVPDPFARPLSSYPKPKIIQQYR
jgi:hypothetical protein